MEVQEAGLMVFGNARDVDSFSFLCWYWSVCIVEGGVIQIHVLIHFWVVYELLETLRVWRQQVVQGLVEEILEKAENSEYVKKDCEWCDKAYISLEFEDPNET